MAACESAPALPILTDPHEVVTAAAASSAALSSVHVQVDLAGRNVEDPGQDLIRYGLEADIDVQGRNVAGRTRMSRGDPPANVEASEFVVLNGTIFSRDGAAPLWSVNDGDKNGDHLPTTAAYLTMIETAIANGTAVLALADAVPCGDATCYHVTAALSREASWSLVVSPLVERRHGRRPPATGDGARAGRARHLRRAEHPTACRGEWHVRHPGRRDHLLGDVLEPRSTHPDRSAAATAPREC